MVSARDRVQARALLGWGGSEAQISNAAPGQQPIRWTVRDPRLPGRKRRLSLPARWLVACSVPVQHLPSSSVDAEGKAGKADEDEAQPLRITEYYRTECYPEDPRQQVGQPYPGDPRCPQPHDRNPSRR